MPRVFLIDGSKYQPDMNYSLVAGELTGVILKSTQNNFVDPSFIKHVNGFRGKTIIGAYHWVDPIYRIEPQLDNFKRTIAPVKDDIRFLWLDIEQWWNDWAKWLQMILGKIPGSEVPKIPPGALSQYNQYAVDLFKREIDIPIAVYTRTSFVREYMPAARDWLKYHDLALAQYPYHPKDRINATWEEIRTKYSPREDWQPAKYIDWPDPKFVQYSGDKFLLPGVYRNLTGGLSPVDLDYFQGSREDFLAWLGNGPGPEPPGVPLPEWAGIVKDKLSILGIQIPDLRI
jgi:hypothetical protein